MSTTGAGTVSVASSSSAGAAGGSVINVSALVQSLVAATQGPQQSIITAHTTAVTTQISAVGTLKGALSTFQSALTSLATPSSFNAETASSSNGNALTATAGADAVNGTYDVAITQLARGQQIVSNAIVGGSSAVVGTGTLQLSLGSSSFSVSIGSSDNTLAGIAAAINSASGNPGISATVLTGTDGGHLVLTSTLTGAANTIQVTETDAGTGLSALTYSGGNTTNYTQQAAAQDAQFTIANIAYTSPSNTVTNALSGVTLQLSGTTAAGSPAKLTVSQDTSTIQTNIKSFVTAYNTLQQSLASLGSFDSTTGTAGPMLGDALLSGVQNSVRSVLYSIVNTSSSTYNSLASIGITSNKDGSLSLDSGKLQTALSTNFSAVSQLFSGAHGIASGLNTQITNDLQSGGLIDQRSKSLVKQENDLNKQSAALQDQMTALTASLTTQYSALNSLLSRLQSTSSYLSQQFALLPTMTNKSSG
jgi:flagellar hook-associated protein 2